MTNILVIGASGFVGGHVARALALDGNTVRCLARNPAKAHDLAGCEIVQGDMSDPASLARAMAGIDAVYISVQTISPQPASPAAQGFMDVETLGIHNIAAAAKAQGTNRAIYVTSLGIGPDMPSLWTRERFKLEQFLLHSGLDATIIRPGMIVGIGGRGFGMTVAQAKSRLAIVLGNGRGKMRHIAIGDLTYYLTGVLNDPRATGQCYEVGGDELYDHNAMIGLVAEVVGRKPPPKLHIPVALVAALAPLIGRAVKSPRGALKGILDGMKEDGIGDPLPIRAILPRPPLNFREAVRAALNQHPKE